MKVLLCGGIRTALIAKELKPRFRTGGIEFITEQDISNISSIFARGEYFDRAVILEPGWTANGSDTNEFSIRQKIANFIAVLGEKDSRGATCVFVASNKEMAQMAAEESIEIVSQCKVLVKKPPFAFAFCADLVTTNLDQFDKSIVYNPDEQEASEEETEDIIWSQDHGPEAEDTGYTLEAVPEVKFTGIEVEEPEEEVLNIEDNTGIDITDFDGDIFDGDEELDITDFGNLDDDFNTKGLDIGEEGGDIEYIGDGDREDEDGDGLEIDEGDVDGLEIDEGDGLEIDEGDSLEIDEGDVEQDTDNFDTILGSFDEEEPVSKEELSDEEDTTNLDDMFGSEDETFDNEQEEPEEILDTEEPEEVLEIEDDESEELKETEEVFDVDKEPEEQEEILEIEDNDTLTIDDTLNFDESNALDSLFGGDEETNIEDEPEQQEAEEIEETGEIDLDIFPGYAESEQEELDDDIPQQFGKEMYKEKIEPIQEEVKEPVQKKSKLLFGKKKEVQPKAQEQAVKSELTNIMNMLNTFKNRGSSLVVTGTPCSGTSTLVFNMANTIVSLGYTVLIVDMDTVNRTQSFMSKKAYEAVHSLDPENASLKQALNAVNNGIGKYINIIKPGFHVLTMGLAGDIVTGEKLAPKQKLARFSSNVRNSYNFIIYDIPFNTAVDYAADITFTADNIVLACEASNHGVMAMMLAMCNVESEDMQEALFGRAQLCMTRYTGLKRILDSNVSNVRDILNRIDKEVQSLLGIDPEFYFSNLGVCGLMKYDTRYEDGWFSEKAYSDLPDGRNEYIKLLASILLKK